LQRLNLEDYYRDLDFKELISFRKADAKVALIFESASIPAIFSQPFSIQKLQMIDYYKKVELKPNQDLF
jgi:hypothetical protein